MSAKTKKEGKQDFICLLLNIHTITNRFAKGIEPMSYQPSDTICQIVEIQRTEKNMMSRTLSI